MTWSACLCGDDRPHVLAIERAGQIASIQAVDDLDRAAILGIPHELKHSMLKDDVAEVEPLELLDSDLWDELRIAVLFRIGRVETVFVLDVDHRARPQDFADEIAAGIGAMRQILDYLLDEWEHRGSPAVDEALAADLDDVCVRQDLDDGLRVEQAHLGLVSQARAR